MCWGGRRNVLYLQQAPESLFSETLRRACSPLRDQGWNVMLIRHNNRSVYLGVPIGGASFGIEVLVNHNRDLGRRFWGVGCR